jgi:hypothetical protein
MALSIDRLQHYTGTLAESFQRYVLLTNYSWHVEEFRAALPVAPARIPMAARCPRGTTCFPGVRA